ncbi:DUF3347 domain-containing protein [Riemerella columbina]|uniref:DUF3347 domain-containing protein n=1 Tax=Riemerella columbina TaxID=103810 RepID=UPI00036A02A5|nr:DUF3347 domain-containing protein [Riemerella columbina]WKS95664.1 DUF3347 domain-containing protein [Riemerella columbina]
MKPIIKSLVALLMLSNAVCYAQNIKNKKTTTVKVYGNCEMCKSRIEKAGNKKREIFIDWNKETKIATISYDSLKTNESEILKRIALSGYDNEQFLSPNQAYDNLPNCCQYNRAKNFSYNNSNHSEHHSEKKNIKQNDLKAVFDNYFNLKDALIESDKELVSIKAKELGKSLESIKMSELQTDIHKVWMKVMEALKTQTKSIANSKDIQTQRIHFISLSDDIYSLLKTAKYEVPVYHQHCPMANKGKGANWLSTEKVIQNPYYGNTMLRCGETVETIK